MPIFLTVYESNLYEEKNNNKKTAIILWCFVLFCHVFYLFFGQVFFSQLQQPARTLCFFQERFIKLVSESPLDALLINIHERAWRFLLRRHEVAAASRAMASRFCGPPLFGPLEGGPRYNRGIILGSETSGDGARILSVLLLGSKAFSTGGEGG